MNRPFYVFSKLYKEEGAGQIEEGARVSASSGAAFLTEEEAKRFPLRKLTVKGKSAESEEGVVFLLKSEAPDVVEAVRLALSFACDGIIIVFGNNPSRSYIRNGEVYDVSDLKKSCDEAKRLCPLFGRKFCGKSGFPN